MEKLIAKQAESNLTEAEAIKQAQEGDAAAFEFLYKAHLQTRLQLVPTHDQESCGSRRFDSTSILAALSKDRHVPRRVGFFDLAAQSDCERCFDASAPKKAN